MLHEYGNPMAMLVRPLARPFATQAKPALQVDCFLPEKPGLYDSLKTYLHRLSVVSPSLFGTRSPYFLHSLRTLTTIRIWIGR